MIVNKGTSPILSCEVQSLPASIITWFKNGELLNDTTSDVITISAMILEATKFKVIVKSSLAFKSVDKTDSANYSCKGLNGFLVPLIDTIHMIVYCE